MVKKLISRDEIWELYRSGTPYQGIAEKAGVKVNTIKKIVRENPGYTLTRRSTRTAYDINQIKALLLEGKKKMEIEAITGLSKQQLATAMNRHSLDQYLKASRGYPREVQNKDREMIKKSYDQGLSMGKIAKQIGRGEEYVRRRLQELPNYQTREQKRQQTATKIRFMLLCGKTKREISDELGFSCTSLVSYYLRDLPQHK